MWNKIIIWIQARYRTIIYSIAFYPAFIALLFLVLSALAIAFDFSETGKHLKSQLHWLSLKDASTARSIISSIVAGIISLTVFSFSMVMIVLNQAASQMSNRVLDKLIGNRFQQMVLGIYIGTIVYALFLLSTIRNIDSGIYIPALSTYLLIIITVIDIFLFIYFLHYITQSVKYEVIIERIFKQTKTAMEESCCLKEAPETAASIDSDYHIKASDSGIFENFNKHALLELCVEHDIIIQMLHPPGTFVLKGTPIVKVNKRTNRDLSDEILNAVYFPTSESIDGNYHYGFRQLMEVAIKALSPGINDPGTAVVSLRSLFKLFNYRACYFPDHAIRDKEKQVRIITTELAFEQIFFDTLMPIWDCGKDDRLIQREMQHLLTLLAKITPNAKVGRLLQEVNRNMKPND